MSLFRREPAGPPRASAQGLAEAPAGGGRQAVTYIAPGSHLQGELTGNAELLIEGEVQGAVRVDAAVVVGSSGLVQGPLSAQVVRVVGRVVGDVRAVDRVEVADSGSLEGNIAAPRVMIAEGAFFKGRVDMKGEKVETAAKAKEGRRARESGPAGAATPATPAAPVKTATDPGAR